MWWRRLPRSGAPSWSGGGGSRSIATPAERRPRLYLTGEVRAEFDAWLEAAIGRSMPPLVFREVRKGVQALSSLYVERRSGADLGARAREGRGKRAALATYYAPIHFLTAYHAVRDLGPERLGDVPRLHDLGCGTGATGAGVARALPRRPEIRAVDRSGLALREARETYAAFGLLAHTRRGRLPGALPRAGTGDLLVLGWALNELEPQALPPMLDALEARLEAGARLLVLEPLARGITPWWAEWADRLAPLGVESRDFKVRLALPEWIARMDRAAGLDHRELGARVMAGPLTATEEEVGNLKGDERGASGPEEDPTP